MLQRILVATDFSPASQAAVMRAGLLCRQARAQLTVLHAVPERGVFDRVFRRREIEHAAIVAGAERSVQEQLELVRQHYDIAAKSVVLEGLAYRVIGAGASAFKADLVIIGAHGEGESLSRPRMLGGTALKCFTRTTLPLLLVRHAVEGSYYKVLAAVDASASSQIVLAWALQLSRDGALCELLHVFEAPFAERLRESDVLESTIEAYAASERERVATELTALTARFEAADSVKVNLARGEPVATLLREIAARQPDLVVLGKNGHRGPAVDPHDFGSVSLRVAFDAPSDVLVVP